MRYRRGGESRKNRRRSWCRRHGCCDATKPAARRSRRALAGKEKEGPALSKSQERRRRCAARASARDLSLSSSPIGPRDCSDEIASGAARAARISPRHSWAGGVSVTCPTRYQSPARRPPPRGGLSLPTALMLPRCVPSPHDTCGVACRPSWLLTQKTTNVALRDNNLPLFRHAHCRAGVRLAARHSADSPWDHRRQQSVTVNTDSGWCQESDPGPGGGAVRLDGQTRNLIRSD